MKNSKTKGLFIRTVTLLFGYCFLTFLVFLYFSDDVKPTLFFMDKKQEQDKLFYQSVGSYTSEQYRSARVVEEKKPHFTLEFGLFSKVSKARNLIDSLAEKNIAVYYTPVISENGLPMYRVRQGLYNDELEAQKMADKLKFSKKIKTHVVSF